jgi:hypothetical protein
VGLSCGIRVRVCQYLDDEQLVYQLDGEKNSKALDIFSVYPDCARATKTSVARPGERIRQVPYWIG